MSSNSQGLLLVLGGAPNTPHVIEGLPGYYSPSVPHIVGGNDSDLTLEQAKKAVDDHADLLELVDVPADEAASAQEVHAASADEGKKALAEARRDGRAKDDVSRTKDEHNAVKEA